MNTHGFNPFSQLNSACCNNLSSWTVLSIGGLNDQADDDNGKVIDLLFDHRPNALEELQTEDGRKSLFAALEKLTEMERIVIIAHGLQGATFRELSQRWEVPQNTLLSHQSRAMKKLKRHFLES